MPSYASILAFVVAAVAVVAWQAHTNVRVRGESMLALRQEYEKAGSDGDGVVPKYTLSQETKEIAGKWGFKVYLMDPLRGFPVVFTPNKEQAGANSTVDHLLQFIAENTVLLDSLRLAPGAVLFRGFDVATTSNFEKIARALEPHLSDYYVGTSPRKVAGENTSVVFSASEFPGYIVIPTHCEMSFVASPPPTIIFYAHSPSIEGNGGETPLADYEAAWTDLPQYIKDAFESSQIRYVRSYFSEEHINLNLFQTKSWQMMFRTNNMSEALIAASAEGFNASFGQHDLLSLVNNGPAIRMHPVTHRPVWHNHALVFHPYSISDEYAIASVRTNSYVLSFASTVSQWMVKILSWVYGYEAIGQYMSYENGTYVSQGTMNAIRAAVWKHTVVYPHAMGDVLILDNMHIAHGRQPYYGARKVYVSFGGRVAQ